MNRILINKLAIMSQKATAAWISIVVGFIYILFEWLFFATKPSFMVAIPVFQKILILFTAALTLILPCLAYYLILGSCIATLRLAHQKLPAKLIRYLEMIPPSGIMACLIIVLVDNFTYTMLGLGIKTSTSVFRLGYGFFFLILFGWTFFKFNSLYDLLTIWQRKTAATVAWTILVLCGVSYGVQKNAGEMERLTPQTEKLDSKNFPNIIIFSSDGVNAKNMSVYGYSRATTPFMETLAKESMVFENVFTNNSGSAGSIAAIFTGKHPATTRLIYPPDILKGKDAYQHLPGILRHIGYKSLTIGERHYADAFDMNMRYSFDSSTFQAHPNSEFSNFLVRSLNEESAYFIRLTYSRIAQRLLHGFLIKKMPDFYASVTNKKKQHYSDKTRMKGFLDFLKNSPSPFFAHIHLMASHGQRFQPSQRKFSRGQKQSKTWMLDYYDDAILSFDHNLREVYQLLKTTGKLDNTILVVSSDHGNKWSSLERVPLIIRFPKGERIRRVAENNQAIDIAPTLLAYLKVPIPPWMEGKNLLQGGEPTFIFASHPVQAQNNNGWWAINPNYYKAPFFSMGALNVIYCNRSYHFDLTSQTMTIRAIDGHTQPCDADRFPTPQSVLREIKTFLTHRHYNTSGLTESTLQIKGNLPSPPIP